MIDYPNLMTKAERLRKQLGEETEVIDLAGYQVTKPALYRNLRFWGELQ